MNGLSWKTEDPITSRQAANLLRDEAFESRLSSLRDVAVELLNAVDCLSSLPAIANHPPLTRFTILDTTRKLGADERPH